MSSKMSNNEHETMTYLEYIRNVIPYGRHFSFNDLTRSSVLNGADAEQFLKELQKDELTLKLLMHEFAREIRKNQAEQALLRSYIFDKQQQQNQPNNPQENIPIPSNETKPI